MAHIAGSQPIASTSTCGSGGGAVITAPPDPGVIVQATAGPSPQETTAMDFQDISEDRHDHSAIMDEDLSPGTPSECPYSNWSLRLKRRTKKKLARGEQLQALGHQRSLFLGADDSPPPLPRSNFKIIIRPKKGLQVKSFTNHQISKALSAACGGKVDNSHFLVRLRPGSNIIIAGPQSATIGYQPAISSPPHSRTTTPSSLPGAVSAAAGQSSVVTIESIYATMRQMLYQMGELNNKVKENTLSSEDLERRIRKVEFGSRKWVEDENNNTRIKAYRRINNTGDFSDADNCDGGGMNVSNG
ncbi:hypothetical protein HPB49_024217 [Dermacentor silvarum]|uniref:Uncharacterized protein n=1 Tax=Dermacentor silvarum TaxID=543639 RepID=A0ACB8DGY3_DERSI|nr:hypothetical protein HPB49_024217 [Dermacentor silvarum]